MNNPTVIENTFLEDLYFVPPKPVVAITVPWGALSDTEKSLLVKILSAVRLSISHVKIIETAQLDVLKWANKPSHVLAFGLEMPGFSLYEPFEVQGISIVLSPALDSLENDKDGKAKLWLGLKKMFP